MAKKLRMFVTAHERDEDGSPTGRSQTFGPNDDMSKSENAWAVRAITNPDVWEGDGGGDEAVTFSDPGNSGPASVEMAEGEDTRPTAKEADQGGTDGDKPAARSTRSQRGRQ